MAKGYDRLRARVRTRGRARVVSAAESMGARLNRAAPEKTGALKNSQVISVSDAPDRISVNITYDVPYWRVTDKGTGTHRITPKNHPVLYFFWDKAPDSGKYHRGTFSGPGEYAFDYVNHPGQKGTNWYGNIVNSAVWAEELAKADVKG